MANPASVHCVKAGGRVEIRKEAAGEVGYCHLPDGRVIEEWQFFRSSQDKNN
jgi:putative hemolysin